MARGENVIIFIIARQGGKTGGIWRAFLVSARFFLTRYGYDISAHEYGMYRDTCSLPYEFEIATFSMSLYPGISEFVCWVYIVFRNDILLCFRYSLE